MAEDKKNAQGKQAPVMDINEQMQNRIDKMRKLEERGIRPFGHRFDWTHHTKEIYENVEQMEAEPLSRQPAALWQSAVMARRAFWIYRTVPVRFNCISVKMFWGKTDIP